MICCNCDSKYCQSCANMTDEIYSNPILKREDIVWLCKICNRVKTDFKNNNQPFIKTCIDNDPTELQSKITDIENNLSTLKSDLNTTISNLETTLIDKITKQLTSETINLKEQVQESQKSISLDFKAALLGPANTNTSSELPDSGIIGSMKTIIADERKAQTGRGRMKRINKNSSYHYNQTIMLLTAKGIYVQSV